MHNSRLVAHNIRFSMFASPNTPSADGTATYLLSLERVKERRVERMGEIVSIRVGAHVR
jgi:hypothetical protein